ncbi:TPA: hypothetical protein ACVU0F_003611 [Yersinia enterocolitica]|uniref:hypothetical protein n=1 Tax=Yersinia enterocolitica TaxID=630 RepID=UPI001C8DFACE|nr:hypothetical protein [Yersinia enterocolitica]WET16111.1 hypothetical protein P2W49_05980 [Yersinia intermedia]EKN5921226.1 hypothetical protein [Yersinia enterocolitica]ELI7993035.1 hypothetical protein [Yersinia enterocolitica]MBX9478132.1 hypothetical protein [Yersinia enterocolitica]HDW8052174.1 hypothetical protein [Yersinia enterocolitica]
MVGTELLLPMVVGAAVSWASYNIVFYVASRQQVSTLRTIYWGMMGYLFLLLSLCSFSTVSAEHSTTKQDIQCVGYNPECYAKSHHNPIKACKQVMDKKAAFRHIWQESETQSVFDTYLWHNEKKKTIQAFGQQAKAINSMNILIPLQYFCIFNANTGEVIAASFE